MSGSESGFKGAAQNHLDTTRASLYTRQHRRTAPRQLSVRHLPPILKTYHCHKRSQLRDPYGADYGPDNHIHYRARPGSPTRDAVIRASGQCKRGEAYQDWKT